MLLLVVWLESPYVSVDYYLTALNDVSSVLSKYNPLGLG